MLKNTKNSKKLGRPEAIDSKELLKRYRALKQFFEHNWGRFGLEFQRVRKPDDVRVILRMVPGVEWCMPFRQEAPLGCLLMDGDTEVDARELARTREQYRSADATEHRLSLEYYPLRQKADEATIALKVFISQLGQGIRFFPFFFVVAVAGEKLGIRDVTTSSNRLEAEFQQAQKKTRDLKEKLLSQSAWYARNEVVRFARSRRHVGTPTTFAKAMAGLPEYGWIHSFRRCNQIKEESGGAHVEYFYQLFQLLKALTRKMKPINLSKLETRLQNKLLDPDTNPSLRAYVSPSWAYLKQAFAECRGKHFERGELPYKIVGRFLAHLEGGKTAIEVELAKREELF